jgi:hypothetical protein
MIIEDQHFFNCQFQANIASTQKPAQAASQPPSGGPVFDQKAWEANVDPIGLTDTASRKATQVQTADATGNNINKGSTKGKD